MRALATVACLVGALAALGAAFTTHVGVSMIGFPDGHVTDYGTAVSAPLECLAWAEGGLGFLFLALAFVPISTRVRAFGLLVAVVAVVGIALVVQVGVPWYFGAHLGLDNGVGG
jgi:hypothetical protein